jgi:anti-sigma factor RsiW
VRHFEYEEWVKYVQGEVDEDVRYMYEQHLATCDLCLNRYIEALENNEDVFPELSKQFTDDVVNYVREHTKPKQQARKNQSFFHYVIAAAMTLVLMGTGVFGELAQLAGSIEQKAEEPSASFTDELMNKTLSFLEIFERNKEAK